MIMIVEDEFLVALDLEGIVLNCGMNLYGSYDTVKDAIEAATSRLPSCAILDVRLADGDVFPLADHLKIKKIPIIFHSAHANTAELLRLYPDAKICQKPTSHTELSSALLEATQPSTC
ncbi:hypothetical protein OQ496_04785 [Acetobacter suratthaniensis]|uniref:Response regulatory domain-containing protein n=1 Tax=Acetobacter suratthaniensis TaxID=1502841 RepID=A0ABS3LN84_9PROT|nr:hypothetical protein [Acetobacter suratthaniensis]MBO1328842.1 hypothetical protein [Acetobacter suratthaniensis]MCX2565772.1 hypothetical protein [Acetobacter suratthaniensis]